jgi:hypothetical protein
MEISCLYGRENYHAGGVLIVCLRSSNGSSRRDYVLLAQACGYINLDPKWVKPGENSSVNFAQTVSFPLDHGIQTPQANVPNSYCLFLTPKVVLSTTQITENGVYLIFDLPVDLIPTYRGLSGSIAYSIILTLQSPGEYNKQVRFPFIVLSSGTSETPYEIRLAHNSFDDFFLLYPPPQHTLHVV